MSDETFQTAPSDSAPLPGAEWEATAAPVLPARKRVWWRWAILAVIFALSAGLITFIWAGEEVPTWFRTFTTFATLVLTAVLVAGWVLILSGFRWVVRLGIEGAVVGVGGGPPRLEGVEEFGRRPLASVRLG